MNSCFYKNVTDNGAGEIRIEKFVTKGTWKMEGRRKMIERRCLNEPVTYRPGIFEDIEYTLTVPFSDELSSRLHDYDPYHPSKMSLGVNGETFDYMYLQEFDIRKGNMVIRFSNKFQTRFSR